MRLTFDLFVIGVGIVGALYIGHTIGLALVQVAHVLGFSQL